MTATVVLGAQWGDEGKGKLVDILVNKSFQLCCRAAGGGNAGHTIVANGITYDFHILPSGLVNPTCINLIGSGCVVHIPSFFKELEDLEKKGLDTSGRILISDRAQIVFDVHTLIDGLQEKELTEAAAADSTNQSSTGPIGTTHKGIGPVYSSKHGRQGARMHYIFDKQRLDQTLRILASAAEKRYGKLEGYDVEAEIAKFDSYREKLAPFIADQVPLIRDAQKKGLNILVEGANALMLDIDYGTYPFVTSSSCGIGGVFTGLAISPFSIKEIVGVVKAYTTRVGGGPFPTEQLNEFGEKLQNIGHEWGATTGRKRRCGWLDLVVVKYSTTINHYTSCILSKLDVLDTFPSIQIAVAYEMPGDVTLESFPADLSHLAMVKVKYVTLPGWESSTSGISKFEDLPANARAYVEFIEKFIEVPIRYIGTGPRRVDLIER